MVLAANASSCTDRPSRASAIALATVSASWRHAVRDRLAVDEDGVALDPDRVALAEPLEDALAEVVEERDAGLDQHLGAEVRVAAGDRRLGVEHRRDADGDQRVGGDPVEVDVVDDRDVARAQPARPAAWSGGRAARCR